MVRAPSGSAHRRTQFRKLPHRGNYDIITEDDKQIFTCPGANGTALMPLHTQKLLLSHKLLPLAMLPAEPSNLAGKAWQYR